MNDLPSGARLCRCFVAPMLGAILLGCPLAWCADMAPQKGAVVFESAPEARLALGGIIGRRQAANIDQWLLHAPDANPGMLEMFRVRDRQPTPQISPWAGEFAGKYLISCVQALRLNDRDDLRRHTARFVADLIATQADDGYLGPFPAAQRLRANWDLWGHYHLMQGLLYWHDYTGDAASLAAARKAADLICKTYLDQSRHVFDAGSPEMNMAVAHVLANLYRRTGEPRYLKMTEDIVKDWERAGDYLRTGVAGVAFYQTPRPRWESLHDLQALLEMWRITGQAQYRDAFTSHWRTIVAFDRRNTGAFSGGEKATGDAYAPSAIETCCTVAWMALSCDMLRLTGDPHVADELELSTFNAALGAQHPSGRWWTYNTPMDGQRKASAHDIVFQARAGSPELNCCSVNGPRSLGMLSEWAVMREPQGIVVNWLGPMDATVKAADDNRVTIHNESSYPTSGKISWHVTSDKPTQLKFRIPAWAQGAKAQLAANALPVKPGAYLEIERLWRADEALELDLPMTLIAAKGEREQIGRVSLYRGPLLLAYDQKDNAFDEMGLSPIDPKRLSEARVVATTSNVDDLTSPELLVDITTSKSTLRLRDFATAGSSGTRYRSWLAVAGQDAPIGPNGLIVAASLYGHAEPEFGLLRSATRFSAVDDNKAIGLNGNDQIISYALPESLGPDFSVAVSVRVKELPEGTHLGQMFSAWSGSMDDPLRITVTKGLVNARIETGGKVYATTGVPVELNRWHRVIAIKDGKSLKLYVDGELRGQTGAPATFSTTSRLFALGGNPLFSRPEFLNADFADLLVVNRVLTEKEIVERKGR